MPAMPAMPAMPTMIEETISGTVNILIVLRNRLPTKSKKE